MRIAQLAPLWESVPPKTYGGTELVVYILCEELVRMGHEVTLFAAGTSETPADLVPIVEKPMRETNTKMPVSYELMSIANVMENCKDFDIIHNHLGFQILPFANIIDTPIVTTLHGAFIVEEEIKIFKNFKSHPYISISDSQRLGAPELNYASTVYNGIQVDKYKFEANPMVDQPYLLFLGRISEEKGTHLAIKLAKETGFNLIMAGKVDNNDINYYENTIKPLIDGKQITFIGEVGHKDKVELFKNAFATIHPVTWPEPFGLVMAESMACGTPVLALNKGSIPEVIKHGVTGFVENNIDDLIKRVKQVENIYRYACRKHIEDNFSSQKMTEGYLAAYKKQISKKRKLFKIAS